MLRSFVIWFNKYGRGKHRCPEIGLRKKGSQLSELSQVQEWKCLRLEWECYWDNLGENIYLFTGAIRVDIYGNNSCLANYEKVRGKSVFCGFSDFIVYAKLVW